MFLALMQYFTFSSKLSMFYLIIKMALYDIIFFIIMFIVLMMGYSIMGHAIFGISNADFNSISNTLMTNILMIIGEYPTLELNTLNKGLLLTFGMTFMLLNMILLNMFIAIIGTHYFEFYIDMGQIEEINIIKILIKIVLDPWYGDKSKNDDSKNKIETSESKKLDTDGNRIDTDFILFENMMMKPQTGGKCKQIWRKFISFLINYANSKDAYDEDFEIVESVDGISHLNDSNIIDKNQLNLDQDLKVIDFNQNLSEDSDSDKDEFYELEQAFPEEERHQLNFWLNSLD